MRSHFLLAVIALVLVVPLISLDADLLDEKATRIGVHTITFATPLDNAEAISATYQQVGDPQTASNSSEVVGVNIALTLSAVFGVIPLYIGLANSKLSHRLGERSKGFIASVAFGIVVFSLIDLFGGASRLGIDFGLRAVPLQSMLLLAFAVGLVIPFAVEKYSRVEADSLLRNKSYALVYLFALSVAFHSFAEGVVVGFDLQSGYSFTFTQRSLQASSFFLHKIAEGIVISIPIMLMGSKAETYVLAGIVGAIPLLLGVVTAYLGIPGVAASYGFALGAGVSTYVLFKLGYLSHLLTQNKMLIFSGIIVGIFFMYFAGWIHSIEI
jgi:zinc transporter ZupT